VSDTAQQDAGEMFEELDRQRREARAAQFSPVVPQSVLDVAFSAAKLAREQHERECPEWCASLNWPDCLIGQKLNTDIRNAYRRGRYGGPLPGQQHVDALLRCLTVDEALHYLRLVGTPQMYEASRAVDVDQYQAPSAVVVALLAAVGHETTADYVRTGRHPDTTELDEMQRRLGVPSIDPYVTYAQQQRQQEKERLS